MSDSQPDLRLVTPDALPAGTPAEKVDAILERHDAEGYVQSLDAHVLYRLIQDAGWDVAYELVPLASPQQVQIFTDLDAWQKDRFDPNRLIPWFTALVEEASDAKFKAVARHTDPELFAMFFKDGLLVGLFDEDGNPPPEFMNIDWTTSPDGVYAVAYPRDQEKAALLRAMLFRLYDVDRVLAWTLLEAARWELMSAMEEEAYRWRTSRLEEFGFVSRDEALELYRSIDPSALRDRIEKGDFEVKIPPRVQVGNLPARIREAREFYVIEILETFDGVRASSLVSELVSVQNRALIADGLEPGEVDSSQDVIARTLGYCSLGLEFLARADDDRARDILDEVPLRDVFSAGFSLTWRLRKTVVELRKRPRLGLVEGDDFSLLVDSDSALLKALYRVRPMYADSTGDIERFSRQAQVDDAAVRLAFVAFKQMWFFAASELEPSNLVAQASSGELSNSADTITFDSVFATRVARALIGGEPTEALNLKDVESLAQSLRDQPWGSDPISFFEDSVTGPILDQFPAATARFASRWLTTTLERLTDEIAGVHTVETPTIFEKILLIRA